MCRGEDLNLHGLLHMLLKHARLPFRHPGLFKLDLAKAKKTSYYISMENFSTDQTVSRVRLSNIVQKTVSILLGAQSIYTLYESTKFILFDRVSVENAISEHQINESSINSYLARTVTTIFGVISLWFAVHLFGPNKKISKNLQTVIAILLILANTYLMNVFGHIPIMEKVLTAIDFS